MQPEVEPTIDTYNVSLDQQISALEGYIADEAPFEKPSKEELIALHMKNVALLQNKAKTAEPKPLLLAPAYAPSVASLNELRKVESKLICS